MCVDVCNLKVDVQADSKSILLVLQNVTGINLFCFFNINFLLKVIYNLVLWIFSKKKSQVYETERMGSYLDNSLIEAKCQPGRKPSAFWH